jgi:Ca2+/Na+ antiporter
MYSYVLSTSITYLTTLTPMSPTFYGTALVAIGAEIPDLIQCSAVAKRGYGAMAVSNALGSQVLNICIGLGLPWTISSASGGTVRFTNASDNRDLGSSAKALFLCVSVFAALTIGMAAKTGKKPVIGVLSGKILVCMYFLALGGFIGWYFTFK